MQAASHGLQDQGNKATLLDLDEDGVFRSWSHATAFVASINTKSSGDVIDRIEYYDRAGVLLGEIVHQDWQTVDGRKLPANTRLKYDIAGEQFVSMINYRGITLPKSNG